MAQILTQPLIEWYAIALPSVADRSLRTGQQDASVRHVQRRTETSGPLRISDADSVVPHLTRWTWGAAALSHNMLFEIN
jgi:hypothetical protein